MDADVTFGILIGMQVQTAENSQMYWLSWQSTALAFIFSLTFGSLRVMFRVLRNEAIVRLKRLVVQVPTNESNVNGFAALILLYFYWKMMNYWPS